MKILLSFCIPTYNRSNKLASSLESVIKSIKMCEIDANTGYEIVISDNCSNDNTEEIVNEFINSTKNYKNIFVKYIKNKTNIGASKNFIKLPQYASGEYIWFLSDDDYIVDTALSQFLKIYNKNYSFIYVSRVLVDSELRLKNRRSQPKLNDLKPVFNSGYEMVQKMGIEITSILGFFSSIIIKKDLWNSTIINTKIDTNNSSEFTYLKILMDAIKIVSCFIIEQPGVLCRLEYRGFTDNDNVIWLDNYIDAFRFCYEIGYDEMRCKEMIKSILNYSSRGFVISKALGKRKGNLFKFKKSKLWYNEKFFNFWFIISLIPTPILNLIYKLAVQVRRVK